MLQDPNFSIEDLLRGGRQKMEEMRQAVRTLREKFQAEYRNMVGQGVVAEVPPFHAKTFRNERLVNQKTKEQREFTLFYRQPLDALQHMITRTCLCWPKGHCSIKTHPEQVYQRKAAGEGSAGSGEVATLERVYGPHPNTGDFFSDAFTALIPPSVAREEPERGLLPAVFNRDGMAKKRLTPMYLSSTSFDLNLMQSALGKVCLGFWPSTKLSEEEDTPEA
uniref:Uncharacterized protein n=1 Tax=Chromera velia CCMP2878 TaxID=1169474 RepID=A0A0G4HZA1_9ALVE|eukprot:Cvel_9690.t1-p1 / transcript=Cvel_9690.t1 / gene=Cvel_9690 / organism=Chromera_velia_CCMP2878 / gene_product=hypothetical protein / transcript_product=hypothetical protein / location=Cvel_scaffold564:75888-76547(+) / protein_length=220 / sequence_SO=supercontig / SO=protein_coding / is_pseudo=false